MLRSDVNAVKKGSGSGLNQCLVALWGRGGMVDAADLKSVDCKSRAGSSPAAPIFEISIWRDRSLAQYFCSVIQGA